MPEFILRNDLGLYAFCLMQAKITRYACGNDIGTITGLHQMKKRGTLFSIAILAACFMLVSAAISHALTEKEVLTSYYIKGVLPSLEAVVNSSRILKDTVERLCERPDNSSLAGARLAWQAAYMDWRRAEPFLFGPGKKIGRQIGVWPVNGLVLDAAFDSERHRRFLDKPEALGFAALEYLLFKPLDAKAAVEKGRCSQMKKAAANIYSSLETLLDEWKGDYSKRFTSAGDGRPFLTTKEALGVAYSQILNVLGRVIRNRIEIPSYFFIGEAKPDRLDAWISGSSKQAISAAVKGLRRAVVLDGETGFTAMMVYVDGLLMKRDPRLARDVEDKFVEIEETIQGLDPDLFQSLTMDSMTLKELHRQLKELEELLEQGTVVLELDVLNMRKLLTPPGGQKKGGNL